MNCIDERIDPTNQYITDFDEWFTAGCKTAEELLNNLNESDAYAH